MRARRRLLVTSSAGSSRAIQRERGDASAIVISDYLKGCITQTRHCGGAVEAARSRYSAAGRSQDSAHRLLRGRHASITPNHHEAETRPTCASASTTEARIAARAFRDRARCESVLMTRGDQGMWLLTGRRGHLPASAREVADVTGAGDTVIATMGWRSRRAQRSSSPRSSPIRQQASSSRGSVRRRSRRVNCSAGWRFQQKISGVSLPNMTTGRSAVAPSRIAVEELS